jgi:arylsulfatase A-like enzyme
MLRWRHGGARSGAGPRAALAAAPLAALAACGAPAPPNLLLVVIDTLRSDHTSAYGYARDTTPRLRALAEAGVRFEAAYAPMGLTGPSHASLFTALEPPAHGVVKNGLSLAPEHVTLAERLAAHGYQTAAVVSSFVLDHRFGLDQGFAHYDDALDPDEATTRLESWEGHGVPEGFDRRGDHTADRALRWLREQRAPERPFFLFVHYFDPHSPYDGSGAGAAFAAPAPAALPPIPGLAELVDAYDSEIVFADAMLGRLLDALSALGLEQHTLVVVTADHGEGLMQRGYVLHGVSVHEEEVRVPLVVRWPGRIAGGRVLAGPVALVDVVPTLAELLEIGAGGPESPGVAAPAGRSLAAALLRDAPLDPERPIFLLRRRFAPSLVRPVLLESGADGAPLPPVPVAGQQRALRRGRLKLVEAPREGGRSLYDLAADPGELRDLATLEPAHAERLAAELAAWQQRFAGAPREQSVPEEDRRRLRALGYAD